MLRDSWGGRDDVAARIGHEEITVGDLRGHGIQTHEDIDAVMALPQTVHAHLVERAGTAERVDHALADRGGPLRFFLSLQLTDLRFRGHRITFGPPPRPPVPGTRLKGRGRRAGLNAD